ncbi:unnamed protein product [Effrenium voratum]|nr:unnamed protein product [Effrenium voratum]
MSQFQPILVLRFLNCSLCTPVHLRSAIPIVLPDWCEKGTNLVYISKSNGQAHTVQVEKIEERQQMVVIRFDSNRKVWKRVPFIEVRKFGDGTLRPLWKKTEVATVPQKPANFVDVDAVSGPAPNPNPVVDAEPSPEEVSPEAGIRIEIWNVSSLWLVCFLVLLLS